MKTTWLFMGLILTQLAAFAEAAVVYLKDGSQIVGTVVSATAGDIQVHTPNGMMTIKSDRIIRVDYADNTPAPAARATPPAPVAAEPIPPAPERRPVAVLREYNVPPNDNSREFFSLVFGVAAPLSRIDFAPAGGGSDTNGDPGLLLGGQYLHALTSHWSTGMNLEYFNRSSNGSQSLLENSTTDVSGHTLLVLAALKYSFVDHGAARPYILGGVGANGTSTAIEATPNPGYGWSDTDTIETRTLVDESRWGPATSLRFGVDFSLMDPSVFSFELGWTRMYNSAYSATRAGHDLGLDSVSGNQNVLTIGARWGWRF